MADKTIPLSKPYTVNGTTFDKVTLREPTYADIFVSGLGYPREFQPMKGGAALMTYPDVVDRYAQRLVAAPGYEFIHVLNTADSQKIQEEICGFFTGQAGSTGSGTSSSSVSDGTPAPSKD